jgi:protein SCO1
LTRPAYISRLLVLALAVAASPSFAQHQYRVRGMVIAIEREAQRFTASIDAIPDYMPAMTMPFEVRQTAELDDVVPGAIVEFVLVVDGRASRAEQLRVVRYESVEQDPFNASRLAVLRDIVGRRSAAPVAIGEPVPDFTLTDQRSRALKLSSLRGKVVVVNFIYTSCALPNFCLRIANNFGVLQTRFRDRLGHDLELLTITFDPSHDTPEVLAKYAAQWNADAATWRFLTGAPAEVERVCQMFGVQAFANEGLLDHTLHTALIDRSGRLIANVEGNRFTATQLGDLTEQALGRKGG